MVYLFLPAAVFLADLKIKDHIEKTKKMGETTSFFQGKILIRKHHNKGTAGQFFEKNQKTVALLALILTFFCGTLFLVSLTKSGRGLYKAGLGLLLGGALSNTYDRVKRGYVVDYISFQKKGPFGRLIYNISDFCIIGGAAMAALFQTKN